MNKKINTKIVKIIALAGLCQVSKAGFIYGPAVTWTVATPVESTRPSTETITTWDAREVSMLERLFRSKSAQTSKVGSFEQLLKKEDKRMMCEVKFRIGNSPIIPPQEANFLYSDEFLLREEVSIFHDSNLAGWITTIYLERDVVNLSYKLPRTGRFWQAVQVGLSSSRPLGVVDLRLISMPGYSQSSRRLISRAAWSTDPGKMIVIQNESHIAVRFMYSSEKPLNYARLVLLAYWSHLAACNDQFERLQVLPEPAIQLIKNFLGVRTYSPISLFLASAPTTNLNIGLVASFFRKLARSNSRQNEFLIDNWGVGLQNALERFFRSKIKLPLRVIQQVLHDVYAINFYNQNPFRDAGCDTVFQYSDITAQFYARQESRRVIAIAKPIAAVFMVVLAFLLHNNFNRYVYPMTEL